MGVGGALLRMNRVYFEFRADVLFSPGVTCADSGPNIIVCLGVMTGPGQTVFRRMEHGRALENASDRRRVLRRICEVARFRSEVSWPLG